MERQLVVWMPTVTFVIWIRLAGAGDALSKTIAVAVFGAARTRLS